MKAKATIIVLIIMLLISNGIWWLYYDSVDRKNDYHINEVCELRELLYCKEVFKKGISFSQFKTIVKKEKMNYYESYKKEDSLKIYMKNIIEKCVVSGRQYCGINFIFVNNKLISIESGYPCH